jgi:glycopeptide antibiotics resistance protein
MSIFLPLIALLTALAALGFAVVRTHSPAAVRAAADVALVASVVAILSLTLHAMDADDHEVRLVPLSEIVHVLTPSIDGGLLLESGLNVLLLMPFGAALRLRGVRLGTAVLVGLSLSVAVEVAQLLFVTGRTTSFDDLLLNTLGTFLGHRLVPRPIQALANTSEPGSQ